MICHPRGHADGPGEALANLEGRLTNGSSVSRQPPAPALEQVDPPVVAAKAPSGELERALPKIHEAVLFADLVGGAVRDRGEGVDLAELPLRPRFLQGLPNGLTGNPPVLELGQDHPPDLIDRLTVMRRLPDHDPAGGGR